MRQIDLDYLVIAALLLSGLYLATTGLVMDLFNTPQFFWHSYAGYFSVMLAGLHVILNWGRITAYLRRRLGLLSAGATSPRIPRRTGLSRRSFLTAGQGFDETGPKNLTGDLGQRYHAWSRPNYVSALGAVFSWGGQPDRFKRYPEASRITLPGPRPYQGLSLEDSLDRRRSRRMYKDEPLTLVELSRLLHAASGLTDPTRGYRAAPSAGALYPFETYVVAHNVADLEPGLYHYAVTDHALEQLRTGDLRAQIVVAGLGQDMLGQAQVCFVLSAIFQRTRWKYRERTYRYVLLEAGHIGQNLYLAATSMGLGACAVGAFLDDKLNDLLAVDGEEEAALYLISVGRV
jgi:SagB-type dehydrogenase family enzyme